MNQKSIFNYILFIFIAALAGACSEDVMDSLVATDASSESEKFVYDLTLNCSAPGFDLDSRASSEWEEGSLVYLLLQQGSMEVYGTAKYLNGSWTLETATALDDIKDATVYAGYVEHPVAVGTDVEMNYSSALYVGIGTYSASNGQIYVTAEIRPFTWRLRFAGEPGQTFVLPKTENDIYYLSLFIPSNDFGYKYGTRDITLTVNADGYTPYIHGLFASDESENSITIKDYKGATYTRKIKDSDLQSGQSGILNLPSSSNTYGWTGSQQANPYMTFAYHHDLGLTVSQIKAKYGKPDMEFDEYKAIYYTPTSNNDILEYIVYNYDNDNVVFDIVLLLKNEDDRIVEAFDQLYFLFNKDNVQYEWIDNESNPTIKVFYVPSIKAIEYYAYRPQWQSLGMVQYADPIFCGGLFNGLDNIAPYEVEIQEDAILPGTYRLVSPYGGNCPFLSVAQEHYIIINARNPEFVEIPRQALGFNIDENAVNYISDIVNFLIYNGDKLSDIRANSPELFGKMVDNTITFPIKTIAYWEDDDAYYANQNRPFVLTIPAKATPSEIDRVDFEPDTYLNVRSIQAAKLAGRHINISSNPRVEISTQQISRDFKPVRK